MASASAPKTDIIRDYLDGSVAADRMPEAEGLIECDPEACTVLDQHDKLETFVGRLQEALAMPPFSAERDRDDSEELNRVVTARVQAQPNVDDTAAFNANANDPSVSTATQPPAVKANDPAATPAPAGPQESGFGFLSPPERADEIGRLNGYRVLKLLGQGGMGVVFEAEDVRLKRRVALKVMKPEVAARKEHRVRFLREAQTAAAVENDFICPIFQVGEENGVPFIAMPFLKGEPLDARLKRETPLPLAEAIRIGSEAAEGLAEAHKAGLVHRDIKPGNIWLESLPNGRCRCRILDFGLARSTGDDVQLTQSGTIMGTPAYMAPEQARARPVDHRADLFSLGVMLYEMTTGRRPFSGNDTMSMLTSLAIDEPVAPNLINAAIPDQLAKLIMRLLAKLPEQRPDNGRAVAEALENILPAPSRPTPTVDQTAIQSRQEIDGSLSSLPATAGGHRARKPWVVLAVSLLLLVGGGLAAYKLSFETKDGTLIVYVDSDADVRFRNGELQIFDADGKLNSTLAASEKNKTLPPGKYLVKIVGADGVKVESPEFVVQKNGKASVRVVVDQVAVAKKEDSPLDVGALPLPPSRNALRFGPNERVEITNFQDHDGPLTVEAYVTALEKSANRSGWVIGVGPGASGRLSPGAVAVRATASRKWHLGIVGEKDDGPGVATDAVFGVRTHVAFVRSDKELRLYVDGRLIGAEPLSVKPARGRVMFGGGSFVGLLDGVRISRTVRYDKSFAPAVRLEKDADAWALYAFAEGAGDTLKDSSGNKHDGRIIGAKWVKTEILPATNYALKFDEGDKIEVRNFALNATNAFTLEAYVAVEELSPDTKRPWPGNGVISVAPASLCLGVVRLTNKDRWNFRVSGTPGSQIQVNATGPVEYKRVVHVAAVKAETELRLYIDGKLVDAKEWPGGALRNTAEPSPLLLGAIFAGTMDEIRLSKVARYDKEFTPQKHFEPDQDTFALYHCDEGSGDVLKDSSGNGHHGKISGVKWVKPDGLP